ncbi:cellulose binding domain-containing protein [Paenibacillus sp. CN-4]|uniref:cellulose binding domain-containing protein n=1 Tax=Paenibacillus nanchangensis TaxID=3348343 RepID=UPI003979A5A2
MIGRWKGVLLSAVLVAGLFVASPGQATAAENEPHVWRNVVTGGGGGFVPGIIFNESEEDLIYARTDIGGAYRWNPADESWIPLTDWVGWDNWGTNGIDALATDPVDPDRVYAAAGTYTSSWDPNNGRILRSTDRGNTWQETELPFKVGGNMPGRSMGERLVIDPNKNNILYFGARSGNGLWRSQDYGVTWSKVNSFPNAGSYIPFPGTEYGGDPTGLAWITIDPSSGSAGQASETIYVGVADLEENVYRSTDGGVTWEAIPGQPAGYMPHHGVLSDNGSLYLTYSDGVGPYDGARGAVWRFNTQTGEWKDVSPIPAGSGEYHSGYGGIAIDAQHPDTIVVATLNLWWPDELLLRSTDGGETWSRIWDWDGYPGRKLRYNLDISAAPWLDFEKMPEPPETAPKLGWMIGDLEIDPFNSDRMMYGTGATIYGTDNLTNWDKGGKINLEVKAKGLEETAVTSLISPPSGAHLLSGVFDVTGFRHDNLEAPPAKMMTNPNSTTGMDYAELVPNFMVRVGTADYKSDPSAKSVGFSYSGGSDWYKANAEPPGTAGGGTVAASADASSVLWSTPDVGVYYSKGGNSWTASQGVPSGAQIASDRVNPARFYAFSQGAFYVSVDSGAHFTKTAASGLPETGGVKLKAVPGLEGEIWLAGGSDTGRYGLWRSSDGGASFTKLPNMEEADVVGFGKAATGHSYMAIYVSAQIDGVRGIFRSNDEGRSWVRINDEAHQYASTNSAITGDPRIYGRVYLGTNGRGIVYADTLAGEPSPTPTPSISPTPTVKPSQSPTPSVSPTPTVKPSPTPSVSPTPTVTPSPTPNVSPTPTANPSPTPSVNPTPTVQPSPTPTVQPTPAPSAGPSPNPGMGAFKIQVFNSTRSAATNSINPRFRIVNTGTQTIDLEDVSFRYYYSADGEIRQQWFVDWSQVPSSLIKGQFVKRDAASPDADHALEVGFLPGAGMLEPGRSVEVQVRFSKENWSSYTQTNDYSFDAAPETYSDRSRVTGYLAGELQWGIEPQP